MVCVASGRNLKSHCMLSHVSASHMVTGNISNSRAQSEDDSKGVEQSHLPTSHERLA